MAWNYNPPRTDEQTLHGHPYSFAQQLPRTMYRILKYILLLLSIIGYTYILSSLYLTSPMPPSPIVLTNTNTYANHTRHLPPLSIIGKVTASFGPRDPVYESAILSHKPHNELHGYPHFILRKQMLAGLWTKHACLLTIIGAELAKPASQRLKWLFWHDRDVILMNPHISLDVFLPPEPEFGHVNLLVTRDRNGLNNGVFFVRVSEWSLKMFASALSVREYVPEAVLKYTEQSGMEMTIERVSCYNVPVESDGFAVGSLLTVHGTALVELFSRICAATMVQWLSSEPAIEQLHVCGTPGLVAHSLRFES